MPEIENVTGDIGVLVVHGIGAQERGATLGKLLSGLRSVDQVSVPKEIHDGVVATVGGRPVRFYEVYWADLLRGDITRGGFLMKEVQSLSWFPWFNLRRGNYRPGTYSLLKLAWWCLALPIVNFFVLFAYEGASFFAQVFAGASGKGKELESEGAMRRIGRKVVGRSATVTGVDRILDEYAGDVFSYVNSAGTAFYREEGEPAVPPQVTHAFTDVVQRFYDQLVKAQADGCTTIQVVAHSLGTVVAYHALLGFRFEPGRHDDAEAIQVASAKVRHVYSIGCPLEKIRFFWPRLVPGGTPLGAMRIHWDNFVSWFDPVAGTLRSLGPWATISNRRLLGGGFLRGHVVYEHSPVFLRAFTKGLCGHDVQLKRGLEERLRDWLLLIGETLLAPAVLAAVVVAGAALFAMVAMIVPYILSWLIRWFLPTETRIAIVNTASLVILGGMILTFLMVPITRAGKVHLLYWVERSLEREPHVKG